MDLVLSDDLASDDERAAVDAVLGAATSGWSGGERTEADGRVARGGHEAREQRHLLLPVLHALQSSAGWISPGGLRYACERLTVPPAEAYGVATFYAMFSVEPRPTTVLHLCDDIACKVAGAEGLIEEVIRQVGSEQVAPEPLSRDVRTRAGGAPAGLRLEGRGVRPGLGRTARPVPARRSVDDDERRGGHRRRAADPTPRARSSGCSAGSAWSTRLRSMTTGRTAGTRRSGGRSSSVPRA